jgi:hypothetical protein
LAEAIFSLSGDYTNIPVDFSAVKKKLGPKDEIKPLGFKNANKMVKAAWELGLVRMTYQKSSTIFLANTSNDHSIPVSERFD